VARHLALVWGTFPVVTPEAERVAEIADHAGEVAAEMGLAGPATSSRSPPACRSAPR
jgi:hypothetical protein